MSESLVRNNAIPLERQRLQTGDTHKCSECGRACLIFRSPLLTAPLQIRTEQGIIPPPMFWCVDCDGTNAPKAQS